MENMARNVSFRQETERPEHAEKLKDLPWPFLGESGHVISLVGAGGKTTLMYALAAHYAGSGNKVVVTTTTHIRRPKDFPVAEQKTELKNLLEKYSIVVAGADAPAGKLKMADHMQISDYQNMADVVLVEADGAKRLPCKVPIEKEPVIPAESDVVIGVMGMRALGRPLEEVCFRSENARRLLHVAPGHDMTEEDLAFILLSGEGTRKGVGNRRYYVALNQCDDARCRQQAETIREILKDAGCARVVCLSLKQQARCSRIDQ